MKFALALLAAALLVAGCNTRNQLIVDNAGGLSVIVQPDKPLSVDANPCNGMPDCHRVIALDSTGTAYDLYAEPGSLVRVFGEDCSLLVSFTFVQGGGFGQTAFQIDDSGHVSTITLTNVGGDGAAGSREHDPCPI